MRHGKKVNHLSRKAGHRRAMLANMATSLIVYKRITTTLAKAKALRKYVEPLITKSKEDTTHNRRVVFSYLRHKEPVKELFDEVSGKIATRPGGYTRIIKLGARIGDNAEMALIELVDYNDNLLKDTGAGKTRRSRRRKKKSADVTTGGNISEPNATNEDTATGEALVEEKKKSKKSEAEPLPADKAEDENSADSSNENQSDEESKK